MRLKDYHFSDEFQGQDHRSKVKVTKVKNVKNSVFSLVSEKVVQGQGHKGQDQRSQRSRWEGQCQKSQGSRPNVVAQSYGVRVKVV